MMSSSERKGSSTETVHKESLDYSPRSPEDKETSIDVAYEESRRSTKRKREDDPDTRDVVEWSGGLARIFGGPEMHQYCVNVQPRHEGPLSALLNDLKRAIEQGEGKDDEEAQGRGCENGTEAYEGTVEDDTEACESEKRG
ncbi:unnamed protein product, partial [Clonostachys chloroleuca]